MMTNNHLGERGPVSATTHNDAAHGRVSDLSTGRRLVCHALQHYLIIGVRRLTEDGYKNGFRRRLPTSCQTSIWTMSLPTVTKTVAVLGSSYGGGYHTFIPTTQLNAQLTCISGTRAAQLLAKGLPKGWRVVVVDRNSHMNHVYVFPRYAVVPGHEHKAFIPYGPMFQRPDARPDVSAVFLHAQVTSLSPRSLTLSRAFPEHGVLEPEKTLNFDYAVYALGSHLPAPIDVWGSTEDVDVKTIAESTPESNADLSPSALPLALETKGTKAAGIEWLKRYRSRIESASSILIVGGGALGVRTCKSNHII